MTLHFAILSFDRYSRDSLIGEVFFTLSEKDVLESIEKEQISVQKDIVIRTVKVCAMISLILIFLHRATLKNFIFKLLIFLVSFKFGKFKILFVVVNGITNYG